jgi:alginate O-acetyltransferase complex protein AlgI
MVFSDPVFLYFFMPICMLTYWAGAWRVRNMFLIAAGTCFYVWGGQAFVLLLAASILTNYFSAKTLAVWRETRPEPGRRLLYSTVVANLMSIAVWKYGGFAVRQTSSALSAVGFHASWSVSLGLPIAISFYTFQSTSYVIDVWRGTARPAPRLLDFAAYILLFPHLIAGPIVRYADIEDDLLKRSTSRFDDFVEGAPRFFWGLSKKVIVADQVAAIANAAFGLPNNRVNSSVAWIGVVAYAVQIYFDFSGYSDMAIGLARMFGFHFPENFNRPYSAVSITDFWRRWHISLSSWFRDYVYIPLGGSRRGVARTYRNLCAVFVLTGLWHGANWTFAVWGCFHGMCLIFERVTGLGVTEARSLVALRRLVTFLVVCVGWAIFRSQDLGQGFTFLHSLLVPSGWTLPVAVHEVVTKQRLLWLFVGLFVVVLPASGQIGRAVSYRSDSFGRVTRLCVIGFAAPIACMYVLSSTFSPFLYFQF